MKHTLYLSLFFLLSLQGTLATGEEVQEEAQKEEEADQGEGQPGGGEDEIAFQEGFLKQFIDQGLDKGFFPEADDDNSTDDKEGMHQMLMGMLMPLFQKAMEPGNLAKILANYTSSSEEVDGAQTITPVKEKLEKGSGDEEPQGETEKEEEDKTQQEETKPPKKANDDAKAKPKGDNKDEL